MKTLQQAIDALPPEELKRRKRRLRKKRVDPHAGYYFPGQRELKVTHSHLGVVYKRPVKVVDGYILAQAPVYQAWAEDPGNVKLYTALFYAANKIKA